MSHQLVLLPAEQVQHLLPSLQDEIIDLTAMALALAAVCTRPSRQLHDRAPAGRLISLPVLAPLVLLVFCFAAQQAAAIMAFLFKQAWYTNGTDHVSSLTQLKLG